MAVSKNHGGLGFRDLEIFNDAMLAKPAWSLLERPDSLCARVLKGRYYPSGDVLIAGCPAGASPIWRAIISGREVLKQGLIRRVGDGMKTEIWHDNWIDGTRTMKPSGRLSDEPVQLVADLIDAATGSWNVELIQKVFLALDATAILSMPRPRSANEDIWAWAWERSGLYSVRSAYRVLVERNFHDAQTGAGSSSGEYKWKELWKLNVLPKIRGFWWRVVKNLLPSYQELARLHVKEQAVCPMCGHEMEDLYHCLLTCDHARCFWEAAETSFSIKVPRLHPNTWKEDMMVHEVVPEKDAELMITVMWAIWHSRNKYTHGEEKFQPQRSMQLIDDIVRSLELPAEIKTPAEPAVTKWEPPDDDWVKTNIDASIDEEGRIGSIGIIERNKNGDFAFGRGACYLGITDPETMELLACRDALLSAAKKGVSWLVLETDCSNIKKLWVSKVGERTASYHIIREMRSLVSQFQGFKLLSVRRAANRIAHCMAKEALRLNNVLNYDVTPGFLVALVQSEKLQPNE